MVDDDFRPLRFLPLSNEVLRFDPRTGILLVMCWSLTNALAFAAQPDAQTRPVFSALARLHLPNMFFSCAMILDICMLGASFCPIKSWMKALTSSVSSCIWLIFGLLIIQSWQGSYVIIGGFSIACSIACTLAAAQFAFWD